MLEAHRVRGQSTPTRKRSVDMHSSAPSYTKPDYENLITRGNLREVLAVAARCDAGYASCEEPASQVQTVPAPPPALCWDPCRACGDINPHCNVCGARNYTVPAPADERETLPAPASAA